MAANKYIDRICLAGAILSLLLTACFLNGAALGIQPAARTMGCEDRLFDTSRVHTLDIVMDDWEGFLETCESEEYASCTVVIDGETCRNVGLRGKGNTSLTTVSSMGSDRCSFKLEFDHYDSGKTYHGLDKLCLNNLIQDNTYMKDYLTYRMMAEFGAASPLCSFVRITVNGEDWGLYLAVEGIEDSFLQRNYGADHGVLYKPDSMDFGGGRGSGKDFFRQGDGQMPEFNGQPPLPGGEQGNGQSPVPNGEQENGQPAGPPQFPGDRPENGGAVQSLERLGGEDGNFQPRDMGTGDVKLQYTDDDPESYANIFESAKTEITDADKARLIRALKTLGEDGAEAVDADQVLRYFVVHNFVVNGDSYTGSMVHNYYLYEENGKLSMLPWDYNLAFGTFQGQSASLAVNDPIDTPLSATGNGERPMMDWILRDPAYTPQYHDYFAEFLETVDPAALIDEAYALIRESVAWDPTKFCTVEEFETGVAALKDFCALRAESVRGQLAGTIPSTAEGQAADSAALVDASGLTLSDMGTMSMGGGPRQGGPREGGEQEQMAPPEGMPARDGVPEEARQTAAPGAERNAPYLLLASVLVLLLGLAAAFKWKH